MKSKEMINLSTEKLESMLKDLNMSAVKASSNWGREKLDNKKVGINLKGTAKKGQKTSLQKDIRRNIARMKTELRRREIENEL